MKIDLETAEPDVRIELVPLIDVVFCILTFFILGALTLTRQPGINVDLPQAQTGTTQMRETLMVAVDSIGQAYVEQEPVTRDQLYQTLLDYQQVNPEGLVVLYADRLASYNEVVSVLDLLRSVGGDRVALATLPEGVAPTQPQTPGSAPGTPTLPADPFNPNATDPFNTPTQPNPFNPNQDLFPGLDTIPAPSNGVPGSVAPSPAQPGVNPSPQPTN
ncbi:biopolymer transporter ExbD [Oculatella sp. LEGE 06141]|uniref:ExbD/TolR family protein n=1 Tax=Oculatella sp. LEGE 06141 TaxID=1828648 RepID=UPI001882BA30|nr:biopolymer transporter ExbD [Oculatella sp. LEGE 06141]MBE9180433.1 biopolymer transporter ExbD [Oculatella sp. LEGE 06141]